jgi:hypothetical protein
MPTRKKRADSPVWLLVVAAQWAFFADAAALLIPNIEARSVVLMLTSPVIIAAAFMLMFNWRNATIDFRQEVVSRGYQWAIRAQDWPVWFWRSTGLSAAIIGMTILTVGIAGLFAS